MPLELVQRSREAIVANVLSYFAAWNETGALPRMALLERCWADDGVYLDPNVLLKGRTALFNHIGNKQVERPGAKIELMSGVDLHHDVVRFLWRLARTDGSLGDISIDFGELDSAGRLKKVVGFFGDAPPR